MSSTASFPLCINIRHCFEPLAAKCGSGAEAGQTDFLFCLAFNVISFLNGSVLDCLIGMEIACVLCKLSLATFQYDK